VAFVCGRIKAGICPQGQSIVTLIYKDWDTFAEVTDALASAHGILNRETLAIGTAVFGRTRQLQPGCIGQTVRGAPRKPMWAPDRIAGRPLA
jgi:hypothetical protein